MKSIFFAHAFYAVIATMFYFGTISNLNAQSPNSSKPNSFAPGELLVAPAAGVSSEELKAIYKAKGGSLKRVIDGIKVHHISVPPQAIDAIESALKKNPKIKYVERNPFGKIAQIPNDPKYSYQWHHTLMGSPAAWDMTTGSSSIPIAVLDTGFDINNSDISGKFLSGYNAATGSTTDYTGNTACSNWGHGTAVASTAAGTGNNGLGTAGVSWQSPIIPVTVFDSNCSMTLSSVSAGLTWAANKGAKVINLSIIFYWSPPPQTLIDATNYALNKGVVIVAAAGNDSKDCKNDIYPCYPQSLPNVLTVSATNSSDVSTSFTNFGSYVSVSAPGETVYTSGTGGALWNCYGTSFSSPIVAGTAALVRSINPGLSNFQVNEIIRNSADDRGPAGWDPYYGTGRVNIANAVIMASQTAAAPAPTPIPTPTPTPSPVVDNTAPTAPSNLSGTVSTSTTNRGKKTKTLYSANLSWSASSDNIGVSSYIIYRNGTKLTSVTGLSFSDKSVTRGSSYVYFIKASDAAGNTSIQSNSITLAP